MRSRVVVLSLMVLALAAAQAGAAIVVVDCANGPFLDIGSAVFAAGSGDTVLVHVCTVFPFAYPPFSVVGRDRVHIVAADITSPAAMGGKRVGFGTVPLTLFDPPVIVDGALGFDQCARIESSFGVSITGLKLINCIRGPGVRVLFSEETTVVANRIETADREGIVAQESSSTRIIGNLIFNNGFELPGFVGIGIIQSPRTLIADNQIGASAGWGIFVSNIEVFDVHIVNNQVVANGLEGIVDAGNATRIERNTVRQNGGRSQIWITGSSIGADVVGNISGFSIVDQGVGTELAENQ